MIDIHTHILPALDDGAADIEETLKMLRLAEKSGVRAMAATSHCNIPGVYENYAGEVYRRALDHVREAARRAGIFVEIFAGAEVFATPELPQLIRQEKILTLNGNGYLLMEFAFDEDPVFAQEIADEVCSMGVVPVIAHAERYRFVQEFPQIAERWYKIGYPLQVNKGSFQGKFGSRAYRTAFALMDARFVSVIASDAHGAYRRTPYMYDVYRELREEYPEEYLHALFSENPQKICGGEGVLRFA